MLARRAVLLTPSKSFHPAQLLSYKQRASVSPLFSTLRSRPQLAENTASLSPAEPVFTRISPVNPLESAYTSQHRVLPCFGRNRPTATPLESAFPRGPFASSLESAYTKNRGGGRGPCALSATPYSQTPIPCPRLLPRLHTQHPKTQNPPLSFQQLAHNSAITGEGGGSHAD
jgi:hypothetical protein